MKAKFFGALHFDHTHWTTTLVAVGLYDGEIHEEYWSQWNSLSPTKICDIIKPSKFAKRCTLIGYNRYDVDNIFQEKLNKINGIKPYAITPTMNKEIFQTIKEYEKTSKLIMKEDGPVEEQLDFVKGAEFGEGVVLYPYEGQRIEYAMAFYLASYLAIRYWDRKQKT